jgi:hypothetical protein
VVQGQLFSTTTAAGESVITVALRTALGVGLAEAQEGAPVAGATVTLLNAGVPVAQTTTDSRGGFMFPNVPPGTYTVQVTINGTVQTIVLSSAITGTVTVAVTATDAVNNDAQLGHAINIDRASASCDFDQVIAMRNQGLGWGVIARQCDAPPGVIGLGRSNLSDDEVADARNRADRGRGRGPNPNRGRGHGNGRPA